MIERVEAEAPEDERMLVGRLSGVSFAIALRLEGLRYNGAL